MQISSPRKESLTGSHFQITEKSDRPILSQAGSGENYRRDIDGLRALAVLSVLFFHAGFSRFSGGFTGVDIFFVISGFLIGGHIYAEEIKGRFFFASFYKRRAKRILPAFFTVLLAVLFLGFLLLSPYELRHLATESIAALVSMANLYYNAHNGYFAVGPSSVPLLMTWSLGVEEQFYIFVPLLMVWLLRFRQPVATVFGAIALLSFGIACYQVRHARDAAFYLLPGRAWELFAGVLLALLASLLKTVPRWLVEIAGVLGTLLLLLPVFLLHATTDFPGLWALPSVAGATLVLWAETSWINRTVLSWKPLRFIGLRSYSLYLWHWPLLSLLSIVLGTFPSHSMALVVLLISLLLSMLTYRWVEQPFRRSSTAARPLLLRYAAATLLLLCVCAGIRQSYGLRFRAPELATQDQRYRDKVDPCLVTDPETKPDLSSTCLEHKQASSVALWGDSHASSISHELRDDAHRDGYDFLEMSKTSCPPLQDTGRYLPAIPLHNVQCIAFNNSVLHMLIADPHLKLVVLTANWKSSFAEPYALGRGWIATAGSDQTRMPSPSETSDIFSAALERTIRTLQQAGKQVIVLQDVPSFSVDPAWRWRTSHQSLRRALYTRLVQEPDVDPGSVTPSLPDKDRQVRRIIDASALATGASVFDPEATLCSGRVCTYRDSAELFYLDDQHLSSPGAHAALKQWTFPPQTPTDRSASASATAPHTELTR